MVPRKPLCGNERALARGMHELECSGVHAQAVFGRIANEGFGINGTGEVDMQVGPLGELQQKRVERRRAGVRCRIERVRGTDFRICPRCRAIWRKGGRLSAHTIGSQ